MAGTFRKFLSALCYLFGCYLLIPASICFLYWGDYKFESIVFYIVACGFLFIGGLLDLVAVIVPRQRTTSDSLINDDKPEPKPDCASIVIVVAYFLGGLFFELASILYWPTFDPEVANLGTWIFRIGSFCYMAGSFTSLKQIFAAYEVEENKPAKDLGYYMWICCILFYILGSVLFLIGGMLSQVGYQLAAHVWNGGSASFALGSTFGFIETIRSY